MATQINDLEGRMNTNIETPQKSIFIRLWPIYIILAGLGFAISQGWHQQLTPTALGENAVYLNTLVQENFWLVLLAFVGIYIAATAFMVPASALTIGGGFLFGLAVGAPATIIDALSYLFTLRLIPLFPFAVVNIAPAILGAKFRDYFITTALGIIPGTVAYTLIGSGLRGTLLEAAEKGETADVGAIVGAAAIMPTIYKKFFKKKPA